MTSSFKRVERYVGSGGARLAAFAKAVCVYFLVGAGTPGAAAAAAKCAPVLCLLITVLAHWADIPPHHKEQRRYGRLVAVGLALSALGDALLVWPITFEAGMAAFACAHAAYIAAFGWTPLAPAIAPPLYLATAGYLSVVRAPGVLHILVPIYSYLLCTMTWRGVARGFPAATGALAFLASDAALGYTMFHRPLPYPQVIVMSTYYLAQLCIALSALQPPPAPASVAPPQTPARQEHKKRTVSAQ